jgi:hypothetical protein
MLSKKRSSYLKAQNIFDCWILAIKLNNLLIEDKIPKELFNSTCEIKFNDTSGGSLIITPTKDNNTIVDISQNLYRTALGNCFVTFDEALDDIFGEKGKTPILPTDDVNSLRVIIYMMRCCFAHDPIEPKWDIRPAYRKLIKIDKINFKIDFSSLNGQLIKFEHHDGSKGLIDLIFYCLKIIKENEDAKNVTNKDSG